MRVWKMNWKFSPWKKNKNQEYLKSLPLKAITMGLIGISEKSRIAILYYFIKLWQTWKERSDEIYHFIGSDSKW